MELSELAVQTAHKLRICSVFQRSQCLIGNEPCKKSKTNFHGVKTQAFTGLPFSIKVTLLEKIYQLYTQNRPYPNA